MTVPPKQAEMRINMEDGTRTAAVVLAAGSGKRMGSSTKKQYMLLFDKPVIYYSLKAFQESFIDEIILVVSAGDVEYCKEEIVKRYGFHKVSHIVEGGRERYHSVAAGLAKATECDYIFIHDGARPVLTHNMLDRLLAGVKKDGACVAGMPVKDTIKLSDENDYIEATPDRRLVWTIQTPQVFEYRLVRGAYEELIRQEREHPGGQMAVTDDAMVVEGFTDHKVKLVEGSYENIKITTPEDIAVAELFLKNAGQYGCIF